MTATEVGREVQWCVEQVRQGLETVDSMCRLISISPTQREFLRMAAGPANAITAVRDRTQMLDGFMAAVFSTDAVGPATLWGR